ncbi:2-isopropylmalate synthase [bacterium]|nr:2-isopropylmalate synthase [bacterium]
MQKHNELIYDWNTTKEDWKPNFQILFDDETLRDGIQSPSVFDPEIEKKIKILHLMDELGIHTANIGLPGAGPRAVEDVTVLCREIISSKLKLTPNCAARTLLKDIEPIAQISQKVGIAIETCTFIGSSPIRQFAENWTIEQMLTHTREAVTFAVKNNLPVMYVTEDTTRATPENISKLYKTAIECGAKRICVCDTVGHATPEGTFNLVSFVKKIVDETGEDVGIDWHGHSDRGLGLANALSAIKAGATRVHGTALGIGERIGNVQMDLLLVNLKLNGWINNDLTALPRYCQTVAEAVKIPIPLNYPVIGHDAFRTGTGVHAAAVIKAINKGDHWLADRVYSGVPAELFGLHQIIEIGPMSGESNVIFWLEKRGIKPEKELVKGLFALAKASNHVLTDEEIYRFINQF